MKMFLGEKVLLDEPFDESITTTTYNRKVNITGVTDLADLKNKIISIKAFTTGSGITEEEEQSKVTLQINDLDAKEMLIVNPYGMTTAPDRTWVGTNQIYQVIYNGNNFILYSLVPNEGGSGGSLPEGGTPRSSIN